MGSVGQSSNERAAVDLDQVTFEQAMLDAVELGYLNVILDRVHQPPLNFSMHLAYLRGSKAAVLDTLERRGAAIDERPQQPCRLSTSIWRALVPDRHHIHTTECTD